ncbi:MAG: DUF975 family protein [Clostridia bacterium]|nr:DUF975 family protein [Clostridia bacterium]
MRIRELRAEARNALKGNLMKIAVPLTLILIFNYLISFGFEFLVEEVFDFNPALTMIASIIFYVIIVVATTILQFGIIKRVIKVSRNEESNFFADTFSGESIKASFSILWGFIKKYAIWVILMILPIISSVVFVAMAHELSPIEPASLQVSQLETIATNIVLGIFTWLISIFALISVVAICVISYRYMLVYYLKHDYPDKPTKELFKQSRMMMKGNKAKAFVIPFTMIGWSILLFVVIAVVSILLNLIWPPEVTYYATISTVPVWATILFTCLSYFLSSLLASYINMTYYQLYMEQKPLELYNDDYLKPETNAKKYIWIVTGIFTAIFLIYILLAYIIMYMGSFVFDAYNL